MIMTDRALAPLRRACKALAEARSIPEVKAVHDDLAHAIPWAKKRLGLAGESARRAEAEWLRSKRLLGKMLKESVRAGNPQLSHDETIGLKEYGISRGQSSRWQQLASLPSADFDVWVEERIAADAELTEAALRRFIRGEPEPKDYTLPEAIALLRKTIARVQALWPDGHESIIPNVLRELADEINTDVA